MSTTTIPSRMLLSTFRRCLASEEIPTARSFSTQCLQRQAYSSTSSSITVSASSSTKSSRYLRDSKKYFSTSHSLHKYKTVEEQKARQRAGPFSWKAGALFFTAGTALILYFRYEKDRMERKRIAEATKGVGKPKVGGRFEMLDQNGKPFTEEDLKGKYALVYFGFTHCPDICPEELDKMARMIDLVEAARPKQMRPVFITCDPARDTPAVVKSYLQEFHPKLIGLTGSWEQVKWICKAYRVYFSTPPDVKPGQDYLVDHSIYFYLMDPEGDFVEALGRQHSPENAAKLILEHMGDWTGSIDKS